MYPLLKLGYLDGYCAGEPWGSVAVQAGVGACLETSATLAPAHPEKVLLVRKDFAQNRADEHERLIAALREYHSYYGDDFEIECPTGSRNLMNLDQVATELSLRLSSLFVPQQGRQRPCHGSST